jgi:hypothetical protein
MMKKKTTQKSLSTGPRTKAGKKVASMNATRHGLTAKNWLNTQEQERYQSLLVSLTEEYEPQTPTENLLVERVATITTRLNRFQTVEDTLFALAREKAGSDHNVINSFGLTGESASDAASIMSRIMNPDDINPALYEELSGIKDLDNISGYGYVLNHLPELRKKLFRECREEYLDIYGLIGGRASRRNQDTVLRFRFVGVDPDGTVVIPPVKTDDELDKSGFKVSAADIVAYIREQHGKIKRKLSISKFLDERIRRTQLLTDSAMPNSDELDRLMRYQTNLDRQLSKALGELLHVIDRRKTAIRKQ